MRKETVDIVEDLIGQLEIVVPFDVITDNGDGTYTIESCDTGYLFPCYKFSLSGVTYTVLNEVSSVAVGIILPLTVNRSLKTNSLPTSLSTV